MQQPLTLRDKACVRACVPVCYQSTYMCTCLRNRETETLILCEQEVGRVDLEQLTILEPEAIGFTHMGRD